MAFVIRTFRIPQEYAHFIEHIAGMELESQGMVIQRALYAMGNGMLPEPRHRDKEAEKKHKPQDSVI